MAGGLPKHLKGRVDKNGETSSSALEFESTQPEKICPSSNTHERAHDQWGHEISLCTRWKADRQVGHPVIYLDHGLWLQYVPNSYVITYIINRSHLFGWYPFCHTNKSKWSTPVMFVCTEKYKTASCPCKMCWWISWWVLVLVLWILPFLNSLEAAISRLTVANGFLMSLHR